MLNRWSGIYLIIGFCLTFVQLFDTSASDIPPVLQGLHNPPLGCHMRLYTYRITQSDSKGIIHIHLRIVNKMHHQTLRRNS